MCSSRLRRVMRGGVGLRNISELKTSFSRDARRTRWKTIGNATASPPNRNNGVRKLISRCSRRRKDAGNRPTDVRRWTFVATDVRRWTFVATDVRRWTFVATDVRRWTFLIPSPPPYVGGYRGGC